MIQILVRPLGASLTRDTQLIGKMDPYCVLILGTEKHQTQYKNEAGKQPKWEESFTFLNTTGTNMLTVQVWDKDTLSKDDLVGEGQVDLTQALKTWNTPINETVNIFYKGKPSGRVFLSIQTIPQGPQGGGCFPHGHKGPGFGHQGHQGGW